MLDSPIHREPIGMYIKNGHEYGYLQAFPVQDFILHHFLNRHNRTIGRGDHQSFRIERETTERATEEVKYQQEQDCGDESRGIEHPTSTDSMIQRNVHDKEYREKR